MAKFTSSLPLNFRYEGHDIVGPAGATHRIPDSLYHAFDTEYGSRIPSLTWIEDDEIGDIAGAGGGDHPNLAAHDSMGLATDAELATHAGAGDPHSVYALDTDLAALAPNNADYLVGTANGSLSGEIVVGTSPGGELGGTWASPTVDSTHAGSSHASIQTAAESTAAIALAAHTAAADPHAGYLLESLFDAKGDIITASADNTPAKTTIGADDTILMADAAAAGGVKWVASASPSAVGAAAATGTADTFTRGDHVHAHEVAHIAHDTLWDAKGDLVSGSGADTAVKTTVGADDTILMADAAAGGGVKWVAAGTPSTQALGDSAVVGTADTFTRGDHKHAMPSTVAASVVTVADTAAIITATDAEAAFAELAARRSGSLSIVIDGGGTTLTTGVRGFVEVPFACTITGVRLFADQSGAIVIDVWKDTYANYPPTVADTITASAKPTISASGVKAQDTTLTGWTKSVAAGDILGFNVDSVTSIQRVTLSLLFNRT